MNRITTSAPGRICLFGEHQDYLGLPVIAMAINLRFFVEFKPSTQKTYVINTPDLRGSNPQVLDIYANEPRHDEDYCWGIVRVLFDEGFSFPHGAEITFRSNIPVRAGCSSSSAMSAAWMRLLLEIGEHPRKKEYIENPELCANLVYRGEKEIFKGAGGMMDQYSCYLGGLLYVYPDIKENNRKTDDSSQAYKSKNKIPYGVERLQIIPKGIILIDSGVPKDTQGILRNVSQIARDAIKNTEEYLDDFKLAQITLPEFEREISTVNISEKNIQIVRDHLINRDLCQLGLKMLRSQISHKEFGDCLNEEHRILSETLGISTKLIDEIQLLTIKAGACGAKINGSGGGGTLFSYAPGQTENVIKALQKKGVRFFPVKMDTGARLEIN